MSAIITVEHPRLSFDNVTKPSNATRLAGHGRILEWQGAKYHMDRLGHCLGDCVGDPVLAANDCRVKAVACRQRLNARRT
jgi:hypothetical protein